LIMTTHWKAILGVLLVFIFGCFCGVAAASIIFHHKMTAFLQHPAVAASEAFEKRVTRNLSLDAGQKEKIHQLFLDNLKQHQQLQREIQPQVLRLNFETFQEINSVLRPDQAETFHNNIADLRKRFAKAGLNFETLNPPVGNSAPGAPVTNSGGAVPAGQ
jgi:hypothetical protein